MPIDATRPPPSETISNQRQRLVNHHKSTTSTLAVLNRNYRPPQSIRNSRHRACTNSNWIEHRAVGSIRHHRSLALQFVSKIQKICMFHSRQRQTTKAFNRMKMIFRFRDPTILIWIHQAPSTETFWTTKRHWTMELNIVNCQLKRWRLKYPLQPTLRTPTTKLLQSNLRTPSR